MALHALLVGWVTWGPGPGPVLLDGAGQEESVQVSLAEPPPALPQVGPPAPPVLPVPRSRPVRRPSLPRVVQPSPPAPLAAGEDEEESEDGEREELAEPAPERWVPPGEARDLRVYDVYPTMPGELPQGSGYAVAVDICVSDHGSVSDVTVRGGRVPAMDTVLRTAVQTWRYRPRLVRGVAVPFCHEMTIAYSKN